MLLRYNYDVSDIMCFIEYNVYEINNQILLRLLVLVATNGHTNTEMC